MPERGNAVENAYRRTMTACFVGYIVQAIANNFAPLLFVIFHESMGIPLERITMLITVNFGIQLCVDFLSAFFVDRIGYRASLVIAHTASALGLALLAVLPRALPDPFAGLMICVVLYAVGGGLLEVLVSPVMEACPTPSKEAAMSLLHSFYCWGHVGVVLLTTLFFRLFGIGGWPMLAVLWALVPLANALVFLKVPVPGLIPEGEKGMSMPQLFRQKLFWIFLLLMICSGACELSVSQWASTFAEKGLGVSKTIGDLAGPMCFAVLMGIARAVYGRYGSRLPLMRCMIGAGLLCLASYLLVSLSPVPALSLIGCGLCGFSVGILWPGTFSLASAALPRGGTALFALLALGGDVGCSGGPTLVGLVSGAAGGDLHRGILLASVFPVLLLAGIGLYRRAGKAPGGK